MIRTSNPTEDKIAKEIRCLKQNTDSNEDWWYIWSGSWRSARRSCWGGARWAKAQRQRRQPAFSLLPPPLPLPTWQLCLLPPPNHPLQQSRPHQRSHRHLQWQHLHLYPLRHRRNLDPGMDIEKYWAQKNQIILSIFSSEKFNPSNYRPLLPPGGARPRIMEDFISNGGRFNSTPSSSASYWALTKEVNWKEGLKI